jgi:hypothetical protein
MEDFVASTGYESGWRNYRMPNRSRSRGFATHRQKLKWQAKDCSMALYKNDQFVKQTTDAQFDTVHQPGSATPLSAIYRCTGCGREIVSEEHKSFPPQNHHQHTIAQGSIRWQMIVWADHQAK